MSASSGVVVPGPMAREVEVLAKATRRRFLAEALELAARGMRNGGTQSGRIKSLEVVVAIHKLLASEAGDALECRAMPSGLLLSKNTNELPLRSPMRRPRIEKPRMG